MVDSRELLKEEMSGFLLEQKPYVAALREQILQLIPRQKGKFETADTLEECSLPELIRIYMNWIDRFIVPRKRKIYTWERFWKINNQTPHADKIMRLGKLFEEGADLTPYLSAKILSEGYYNVPSKRKKGIFWGDKDMALNAYEVHHLHLNPVNENGNRRGQSNDLLFVKTYREEVVFLMLGNHKSFDDGTLNQTVIEYGASTGMELPGILPPRNKDDTAPIEVQKLVRHGLTPVGVAGNQMVIGGVMSLAGTSFFHTKHADLCCRRIASVDTCIDNPDALAELLKIEVDDIPHNPDWLWSFYYADLFLLDKNTNKVVFAVYWKR